MATFQLYFKSGRAKNVSSPLYESLDGTCVTLNISILLPYLPLQSFVLFLADYSFVNLLIYSFMLDFTKLSVA